MLQRTTSRFSGEKYYLRKFWLIINSLAFVSINIYAQNPWKQVSALIHSKAGATASVINDKIFVIGGSDATSYYLANNEMYDPLTNTWEVKAPMPTGRGYLSSAVLNDSIYVVGGGYPTWMNKVEAYAPLMNTWTTKPGMLVYRINGRAAVVNGKIYVIGGYPDQRICEVYNPQTNTWTYISDFPETSGGVVSVAVYNGFIYVFGGGYSTALKTTYVYNPQTDTWTRKSDMPTQRTVAQACLVNGKIYVIGGATAVSQSSAAVEMYDPAADTWYIKSNMPVPSAFLSCAVVNNKIYVFEGTADWQTSAGRVWEYDPALDPVNIPIIPVELTSFTAAANGKEVTLNWTTATELNNQGFEVQRKFGSNDFVTIGSVRGNGTTTTPHNYSFVDKLIDAGKYFYRLKQIDFGGKYEYSQEVEVNWSPFITYKLEQNYPNPFNPTTTIGFGITEKGNVRLSILNILGEEIRVLLNEEREAGYHSVDFSAGGGSAYGGNALNLSSGVYFYQLKTGSFVETRKMLLLR